LKIAIVEDSPQIIKNLSRFISSIKGTEISGEADSADSAVELIRNKQPDIIVLDIELKNGSGFDVLNKIKNRGKTTPIVMIFTNLFSFSYKEKALKEGADYFFDKTNDLEDLIITIESFVKNQKSDG
jgi:DNA-binding NarL/FixJ family response regulator